MKDNLPAIFIPIVLIIFGTLSPSNGVDDGCNKSPLEILSTAFVIMLVGIIVYLIIKDKKLPSLIKNRVDKQKANTQIMSEQEALNE